MLSLARRWYWFVLISLFSILVLDQSKAHAQSCSGQSSMTRACIQNPEGLLAGNEKATKAVAMTNWILGGVALLATIVFLIKGSKKLSDDDYVGSLGPFAGALISGITIYLAGSIAL
ncbi:MAG: hypothetical protein K2P81_11325 [Bacteriovoracaceae bacterium]|nr:hypothetical protein [Bacteriovoracaceae bacterium]